jgi:hypothetical protein
MTGLSEHEDQPASLLTNWTSIGFSRRILYTAEAANIEVIRVISNP